MVATIQITTTPALGKCRPSLGNILQDLQERLNALPPDEIEAVAAAVARVLTPRPPVTDPFVTELLGGRTYTPEQRAETKIELLTQQFAWRKELLQSSLTASQVAKILGTTRQTPHDRVKSGTLLAVMDRGALRFPDWQFDHAGKDSVIDGLPDVLRVLDVSPLAKVSWLTHPNEMLDGVTPLDALKSGDRERVVRLARAVGVW